MKLLKEIIPIAVLAVSLIAGFVKLQAQVVENDKELTEAQQSIKILQDTIIEQKIISAEQKTVDVQQNMKLDFIQQILEKIDRKLQ